jgi:hypothetical protein
MKPHNIIKKQTNKQNTLYFSIKRERSVNLVRTKRGHAETFVSVPHFDGRVTGR